MSFQQDQQASLLAQQYRNASVHHAASSAPAPTPTPPPLQNGNSAPGIGYDPSITVGPDNHVYGYQRVYDAASGNYAYQYKDFGDANDPGSVSKNSGIPAGQLQTLIGAAQVQNQQTAWQQAQNPYTSGTNQGVSQQYQSLSDAQRLAQAQAMQQQGANGQTYADMGNANTQRDTQFQYSNGAMINANTLRDAQFQYNNGQTLNQSSLNSAVRNNAEYANWAGEGIFNPSGMTNGGLAMGADNFRNQQGYAQGWNYNGQSGIGGLSNGQVGLQAGNYQNQSSYLEGQNYNAASGINGMSYGQLGMGAQNYQNQSSYMQGQNYNTASGVGNTTYGQLGVQNANQQSVQNNAYNANYSAGNPYTGMSNGQTGLAASNTGAAVNLQKDTYALSAGANTGGQSRMAYEQGTKDITDPYDRTQASYDLTNQAGDNALKDLNRQYNTATQSYNLGSASYTNGQSRQQYQQGTQDLQNPYDRSNAAYQLANQPQQQALASYRQGLQTQQAQTTGQSRNLQGVGWAGINRPIIAGT